MLNYEEGIEFKQKKKMLFNDMIGIRIYIVLTFDYYDV